jgi:cytochrome P450
MGEEMNQVNGQKMSATAVSPKAPAHVPPAMIRDYEFYYVGGSGRDTFRFLGDIHSDQDVFYNLRADPIICPNGSWFVSSFELMNEVLQNPQIFSSRDMVQFSRLIGETWDLIPLELDPPEHGRIRLVAMPLFGPARMAKLSARIRQRADELIAKFRTDGECEFVGDFAVPFPVSIFLELLDLPKERLGEFVKWAAGISHSFDPADRREATRAARNYLRQVIAERRMSPGEDIISQIVTSKSSSEPLTEDEILGLTFLIFIGGIDTVTATLGCTFAYLARHPEAYDRLRNEPGLIPAAVEEFVRAFSVVVAKRKLTRDVDFHGAPMKAGDYVTCVMGLADTDPKEFGTAVQIDRPANRHVGFGMGPHRCLGSHLARLELKVALEAFLEHIPTLSLAPGANLTTHGAGGVYGYDSVPLVW